MDERQRRELFDLWKQGVPFPQLASVVDGFIQEAHASGGSEEAGGGAEGLPVPSGPTPFFLDRG